MTFPPFLYRIFVVVDIGNTTGESGRLIKGIFHAVGLHAGYVN
jgi:hypothetical protein